MKRSFSTPRSMSRLERNIFIGLVVAILLSGISLFLRIFLFPNYTFFGVRLGVGSGMTIGGSNNNLISMNKQELVIEDLNEGEGRSVEQGDIVVVHYVGTFQSGEEFDSSRRVGRDPFQFTLGAGQVIAGWDKGVQGMKIGGRRRLTVPPELGYGAENYGPIPGNSTLIFEIELLSIFER